MSAQDPTPADVPVVAKTSRTAKTTPEVEPVTVVEPVETYSATGTVEPTTVVEPAVVEPVENHAPDPLLDPVAEPAETATAVEPVATESAMAGQQVVYVQAPVPPRVRSNRVVGVLLALLGAVLFAVVFAAVVALVLSIAVSGAFVAVSFSSFLQSAAFWVPVLVFTLAFILLVLIVNRAGWVAHVFGSLLVALAVYFGTIGLLLVSSGLLFPDEGKGLTFAAVATQPTVILAAIVAREVSIWIGLAIAARGRRVKARNVENRTAWEQEQADQKAGIERAATSA
ncbi:hypothetical protein BH11ACT3_BH11ACT3_12570 [soil metagenome]